VEQTTAERGTVTAHDRGSPAVEEVVEAVLAAARALVAVLVR